MVNVARGLARRGLTTATFDFAYITSGRRAPDPAPVLEARWRSVIEAARRELGSVRLFIGGKSMGGRIASQVAAQGEPGLSGLVFLGYPLHPPGKPQQRRDAHLPRVAAPMLFVQGSRDAFGTADEMRALTASLHDATMHVVEGGDHSFRIAGRGAPKPEHVLDGIMDVVASWIHERAGKAAGLN